MSRLIGIPVQRDIERFLSDNLTRGDQEALAAILDCSPSLISQQVDPDNEKKSWLYQGIRFLWATHQLREDLGDTLWGKLQYQRWLWKGKSLRAPRDVAHLAGGISSITAEILIAELEQKPMQVRLKEAWKLRAELDKYILGLMHEDMEDAEADEDLKDTGTPAQQRASGA